MGMRRKPVSKGKSRKQFNRRAEKTASLNLAGPRRGGIRL